LHHTIVTSFNIVFGSYYATIIYCYCSKSIVL